MPGYIQRDKCCPRCWARITNSQLPPKLRSRPASRDDNVALHLKRELYGIESSNSEPGSGDYNSGYKGKGKSSSSPASFPASVSDGQTFFYCDHRTHLPLQARAKVRGIQQYMVASRHTLRPTAPPGKARGKKIRGKVKTLGTTKDGHSLTGGRLNKAQHIHRLKPMRAVLDLLNNPNKQTPLHPKSRGKRQSFGAGDTTHRTRL